MKVYLIISATLLMAILWVSCQEDNPVPKPRTYPRMDLPTGKFITFDNQACPFTFEYPDYNLYEKSQDWRRPEELTDSCWFSLLVPELGAHLFMSYHHISSRRDYDKYISDTYRIIDQINKRSDYTEEVVVRNNHGVAGLKFLFTGSAASPIHFYLSDTTQHFAKGALYYDHGTAPDSMRPATNQLLQDIDHMLASWQWY